MQSRSLRFRVNPRDNRSALRAAFSLIELVVVILIIAILASLILNGVMAARTRAVEASVTAEIKNLEKSISDFQMKFGIEPPSSITLYETGTGWAASTPTVVRSRGLIRQIWPQFNFALNRDINGDGDTLDSISLQGAECLVFFLGGVNSTNVVDKTGTLMPGASIGDTITQWVPLGFSVNPLDPFARGGSRLGPYYEFDSDRLYNIDSLAAPNPEGAPEYLDSLPSQTKPLIYASSYQGRGYVVGDLVTGAGCTFVNVYSKTGGQPYNPKSFQIISAGMDNDYGTGGVYDDTLPATRSTERDNLTNFKGGRLE